MNQILVLEPLENYKCIWRKEEQIKETAVNIRGWVNGCLCCLSLGTPVRL